MRGELVNHYEHLNEARAESRRGGIRPALSHLFRMTTVRQDGMWSSQRRMRAQGRGPDDID